MKLVNVAAVQFTKESVRGRGDAAEIVLADTRATLDSLRGYGLDLVVLSEGVGAVGQTSATAESIDEPGPFLRLYREWAAAEKCHVAGSVLRREDGRLYNSIAFIGPDGGPLSVYRKSNLTDGELEAGLTPGNGAVVVDTAIGRLGGAICFDLNFEWLRQQYRALKPDILVFSSMFHGGLLQQVWAYECRAFFIGAWQYFGCTVRDPFGRPMKATDCYSLVARATINLDRVMVHLDHNREKFAAIEKKYLGRIVIDVPHEIGSALICSTSDDVTAMDIVKEFDLQLLDDYLAQSLAANDQMRPPRKESR